MAYPLPIVYKHGKSGTVEIVYRDRIETYVRKSVYTEMDLAKSQGIAGASQQEIKKTWYEYIFDRDYWRGNGFRRVKAKSDKYDEDD
jgi:hypothetical protein